LRSARARWRWSAQLARLATRFRVRSMASPPSPQPNSSHEDGSGTAAVPSNSTKYPMTRAPLESRTPWTPEPSAHCPRLTPRSAGTPAHRAWVAPREGGADDQVDESGVVRLDPAEVREGKGLAGFRTIQPPFRSLPSQPGARPLREAGRYETHEEVILRKRG